MNPTPTPGTPVTGQAKDAVSVPAVFLIITGVVGLIVVGMNLWMRTKGVDFLRQVVENDPNFAQSRPQMEQFLAQLEARSGWIGIGLSLVTSVVTIFGGIQMRNLRLYGLAIAASIVAMLPIAGPCCCIGLPVGIWSLVVLLKPEVKSAFT